TDQLTRPHSVASGVDAICLLSPPDLIHELRPVDRLVAHGARFAVAEASPDLRTLKRQLSGIDSLSHVVREHFVCSHPSSNESRSLTRRTGRGTPRRSTHAAAPSECIASHRCAASGPSFNGKSIERHAFVRKGL